MKIGFVSLPVPGHFNPMSALARQLQSRNHDVVVLSLPLIEPLARAANLSFIPFGAKEFPDKASAEIISTLSRLKGEEGLQFTVGVIAEMMKVKWRELPKLLSANGIDALVLDNYDFYVEVVPMRLGMPYAVLSNALHFDYSGCTPNLRLWLGAREHPGSERKKPARRLKICADADPEQRRDNSGRGASRNQT
jgi:zeaxanthin glucosyltransferase